MRVAHKKGTVREEHKDAHASTTEVANGNSSSSLWQRGNSDCESLARKEGQELISINELISFAVSPH